MTEKITEEFVKENDYTLSVVRKTTEQLSGYYSGESSKYSSLTRTFNFLSAQVTTIARDGVIQPRYSDSGSSAAVTTQMIIQNFSDIDSKAEIKAMHEKLVNMGGKPPALSFELDKRPTPRLTA